MTPSQITRTINWIAMPIALGLLALVAIHIYQRHFVPTTMGMQYHFDDLPPQSSTVITADISNIIQQHIFGQKPTAPKVPNQPVVKKAPPTPAPKTRLNLKLTGIIDGSSPENGMAILEVERGKTLVVSVGEKIGETDAVLHQVLPGEVLIDRDGTIESVKMIRKTLSVAHLDPALSANQPEPNIERGIKGEVSYSSGKSLAVVLPEASDGYRPQNGTESSSVPASRSPVNQGQPSIEGKNVQGGPPANLPVPRTLRN